MYTELMPKRFRLNHSREQIVHAHPRPPLQPPKPRHPATPPLEHDQTSKVSGKRRQLAPCSAQEDEIPCSACATDEIPCSANCHVRASIKEDNQRTTTLTDNKKRDYENEGSSMHENSCIVINYAHMFDKCFRSLHIVGIFRSVLHVINSIVVAVTILLNF